MSSAQVFSTLPETCNPESLTSLSTGLTSSGWYDPVSYSYNQSYMTPYTNSSNENQTWTNLPKPTVQDVSLNTFTIPSQQRWYDQHRPRSSPSSFGAPANINWPIFNGLGIYSPAPTGHATPVTSSFPANAFQAFANDATFDRNDDVSMKEHQISSTTPEMQHPQPRKAYTNIAPNPSGVVVAKRRRDDDDDSAPSSSKKARKRTISIDSTELSEDNRYLLQLKDEERLPWKGIAKRFQEEKGENVGVATLQMRYKRMFDKHRIWQEDDVRALQQAYEFWEKSKWEIISQKMTEFGTAEKFKPSQCSKKWHELEAASSVANYPMYPSLNTAAFTPALTQFSNSQTSSPIEAPPQYAWAPMSTVSMGNGLQITTDTFSNFVR